jgi:DMSO/TMAO reductase YedYZ molybdopterin-dependent catalytic subunit
LLPFVTIAGPVEMIQRSERPPNYETPLEWLNKDGPFTRREHFFTRYHLSGIPEVDAKTWTLELKGESLAKPMRFSLSDLKKKFPQVEVVALAYCSGNSRGLMDPHVPGVQWNVGAMSNARWRGVRLRDVLTAAGLKPEAVELVFDGADRPALDQTPDFRKSLPVNKAMDENTLIAFEMNGKPLPQHQGFPARIIVPGWTATYWVKHVISIEAISKPYNGFWMTTAYRVPRGVFPGDSFPSQNQEKTSPITSIVVNSLITNARDDVTVKKGHDLFIKGLAWDGGSGIEKEEISTDNGQTWQLAKLDKDYGNYSWRGFHYQAHWDDPGEKTVLARATNKAGLSQGNTVAPNPGGYQNNLIQKLKVVVE